MIESELLSIRVFLVQVTLKYFQGKYLLLVMFYKINSWTYKTKYLYVEK